MLRSFKNSDLVIFISNYAREELKKYLKKPLKKSVLINHGVDMSASKTDDEVTKIYNFREPSLFILHLLNLISLKSK